MLTPVAPERSPHVQQWVPSPGHTDPVCNLPAVTLLRVTKELRTLLKFCPWYKSLASNVCKTKVKSAGQQRPGGYTRAQGSRGLGKSEPKSSRSRHTLASPVHLGALPRVGGTQVCSWRAVGKTQGHGEHMDKGQGTGDTEGEGTGHVQGQDEGQVLEKASQTVGREGDGVHWAGPTPWEASEGTEP